MILKVTLPGGLVRGYHGELSVQATADELHIVNHVQEADYLASAVQSEMGEAPLGKDTVHRILSKAYGLPDASRLIEVRQVEQPRHDEVPGSVGPFAHSIMVGLRPTS